MLTARARRRRRHDHRRRRARAGGGPPAAGGTADPALLADRPAEERARPSWSVRWAVPVTGGAPSRGGLPAGVRPVVHAPTPTDEPLGLPALLLASFPLSPTGATSRPAR